MTKSSISIFNKDYIIPLSQVQHIEKHWWTNDVREKDNYRGINIITNHTKWSTELDTWENSIYLSKEKADEFIEQFAAYHEQLNDNGNDFKKRSMRDCFKFWMGVFITSGVILTLSHLLIDYSIAIQMK
jgi:hypothetical protein